MPQALVEAEDAEKGGGQLPHLLQLEVVRMRDLQEALPLRLQVKRPEVSPR
jgi:hypothetical protein